MRRRSDRTKGCESRGEKERKRAGGRGRGKGSNERGEMRAINLKPRDGRQLSSSQTDSSLTKREREREIEREMEVEKR